MNKTNIILTGFMGTGKSELGRSLANELQYQFIDTDHLIEEQSGKTITEIFTSEGEAAFRKLEAELVQQLANRQKLVIATGGGLMMNRVNVTTLQRTGRVLCLVATPEEILERISRQPDTRPLLRDPDPLLRITELLKERAATYNQFPQFSTSGKSQDQLVNELCHRVRTEGY